MNLPDEKREALAEVLDDHRRGESQRDCIEGLGWVWACWCECGWHGPDRDHQAHLADALAPLLAEWLAEAEWRGRDHGFAEGHFPECADAYERGHADGLTEAGGVRQDLVDRGLDAARRIGLAEGEARMRARVEAVLAEMLEASAFSRRLVSRGLSHHNEQLALLAAECREGDVADIRAALAADTPEIAPLQGPRSDEQGQGGVVAHPSTERPSEQYDSE